MISQTACPGFFLEEHRVELVPKSEATFHDQKSPKTADKIFLLSRALVSLSLSVTGEKRRED